MNGNLNRRYFVEVFENCSLDDWQYEMRREIQELLPGLFLGPFNVCRDTQLLRNLGVTHILSILDNSELNLFRRTLENTAQFTSHVIPVADTPLQPLIAHFPVGTRFIKSGLEQGGKVLICCNGGMSRSPCFAIAYIMETFNIGFRDAYQFVQARRLCINPNEAFKSQLKEYEPIYMAAHAQDQFGGIGMTNQKSKKRTQFAEDNDDMAGEDDTRMDLKRPYYSTSTSSAMDSL